MIKTDHWIKAQCTEPSHVVIKTNGVMEYASEPFSPTTQKAHDLCKTLEEINAAANLNIAIPQTESEKVDSAILESFTNVRPIKDSELANWKPMIEPFVNGQVRSVLGFNEEFAKQQMAKGIEQPFAVCEKKIVSYGLSSMGYDVRLGTKFKIFTNINTGMIDPLDMKDNCYVDFEGETCIIPPNSYVLGHTVEYFRIPRDVMIICLGKSTYARAGAIINVTPIEPGFAGQVVIEISNATPLPMKVHANQGIAQFVFFQSDEPCSVSYADRAGKYQGQTGVVTARV